MRILIFLALVGFVSPAMGQCVQCQQQWQVPTPAVIHGPVDSSKTETYSATMANSCRGRQRVGNRTDIQVALFAIQQMQSDSDGGRITASRESSSRSGRRRFRLFGRRGR